MPIIADVERERTRRSRHTPSPSPCVENQSLPTPATSIIGTEPLLEMEGDNAEVEDLSDDDRELGLMEEGRREQQQKTTSGEQKVAMHVQKEGKEEQVLREVKLVQEEQEGHVQQEVREEREEQRNVPSPPSPPLDKSDQHVEQSGELVASPPLAPSLSSPHAEEQWWLWRRQAGRGERHCSSRRW